MNSIYCKQDGMVIKIGTGSLEDQLAHENGFCNRECQVVYEAIKQSEMGRLMR